jgi:hypothetical protein
MRGVLFYPHAAAAAVALLATPEFVVEKGLIYGDARRKTADEGYEGFAVAFAGCGETKHELLIIKREEGGVSVALIHDSPMNDEAKKRMASEFT